MNTFFNATDIFLGLHTPTCTDPYEPTPTDRPISRSLRAMIGYDDECPISEWWVDDDDGVMIMSSSSVHSSAASLVNAAALISPVNGKMLNWANIFSGIIDRKSFGLFSIFTKIPMVTSKFWWNSSIMITVTCFMVLKISLLKSENKLYFELEKNNARKQKNSLCQCFEIWTNGS